MRKVLMVTMGVLLLEMLAAATADASYCGAMSYRCCRRACWRPSRPCACQPLCCGVNPCQELVYEEQQCVVSKTVYEEVVEPVVVNSVKYVHETEYRCVESMVCQPKSGDCSEPAKPCAPANSNCCGCPEMEMKKVVRKVPCTVLRPVCYQTVEDRIRLVAKQVPCTVTVCVPRVVCKPAPIDDCSPLPKCCTPACNN